MDEQQKAALMKRARAAVAGGVLAVLMVVTPYFEGTSFLPYRDIVAVLTVCRGHTGSDVIEGHLYTKAECDRLFAGDAGKALASVEKGVKVRLGTLTLAALTDFTFNVGGPAFLRSTLLKRLNADEGPRACDEFMNWLRAGLFKPKGLRDRREFERAMCIEGFQEVSR